MDEVEDKRFFRVYFSPEREIRNMMQVLWLGNPFPTHGLEFKKIRAFEGSPKWFRKELKKCKYDWQARRVIGKFVRYLVDNAPQPINETEGWIENDLNPKADGLVKLVEEAYGKKFPYSHVNIFLTLPSYCPIFSDENAFTLSLWAVDEWREIIIHELNHMMFFRYYPFKKLSRKITETQYSVLLEALTVVTNLKEKGYPGEKEIREDIKELLEKNYKTDQIIKKLLKSKLLLDIKDDERLGEVKKYGFLDRLSYVVHDLRKTIYEGRRGIS